MLTANASLPICGDSELNSGCAAVNEEKNREQLSEHVDKYVCEPFDKADWDQTPEKRGDFSLKIDASDYHPEKDYFTSTNLTQPIEYSKRAPYFIAVGSELIFREIYSIFKWLYSIFMATFHPGSKPGRESPVNAKPRIFQVEKAHGMGETGTDEKRQKLQLAIFLVEILIFAIYLAVFLMFISTV